MQKQLNKDTNTHKTVIGCFPNKGCLAATETDIILQMVCQKLYFLTTLRLQMITFFLFTPETVDALQ